MLTQQNVFHASDGPHDAIGTLLRMRENAAKNASSFFDVPYSPQMRLAVDSIDNIIRRHYGERDMSKITREWRVTQEAPDMGGDAPVRQVYTWLISSDDKIVIVSKDKKNWQLPGGKPDPGENAEQVAVREVFEETGIDISNEASRLNFFGAYTIVDKVPTNDNPSKYRQVRSWLRLPVKAHELELTTIGESTTQRPEDAVRFVKAVPLKDIAFHIPWLPQADEYKYLKRNRIIDTAG